jgi:carbon-monoxide dehydrogenase medium subunit
MKPVAFEYARPRDLASALAALSGGGEASRVIAGGQSLGPMLNLRLARPSLLVDIGRIEALRGIERRRDAWHIGATTTHAMLEDRAAAMEGGAMIAFVARGIAYRAVRNRGTVGGSLAHADPAGDWPLALAALDAVAVARRGSGTREIAVAALAQNAFSTCLERDEILTAVRVPVPSAAMRWGYAKACRKAGELAEAAAAVVVDPDRRYARIVIGALGGPARIVDDPDGELARRRERHDFAELEARIAAAAPELDFVERRQCAGTLARALAQAQAREPQ